MDRGEAATILGVPADADPVDARAAYLRLVRSHHPDVAPERADATAATARLTEAWAVFRRTVAPDAPPPAPPSARPATRHAPGPVPDGRDVDADVAGTASPDFLALLDAASALGEVTWADRHAQMVQLVLRPDPDGPTCQLVAGLLPVDGGFAIRTALESLEARPAPPLEPLAEQLAALVARSAERLA
jgi:hypothetical protein